MIIQKLFKYADLLLKKNLPIIYDEKSWADNFFVETLYNLIFSGFFDEYSSKQQRSFEFFLL